MMFCRPPKSLVVSDGFGNIVVGTLALTSKIVHTLGQEILTIFFDKHLQYFAKKINEKFSAKKLVIL